ncbi:MAG TPA: cation:proton antiporter [Micromonosporaceae bacterium]
MPAQAPTPPIEAHDLLIFLLQVGLLLILALLLGRLAVRLKMPAIVGELCAGVILGPSILQQSAPQLAQWLFPPDAEQFHMLDAIGQVGVLLLVGITGAHLDLALVRRRGVAAAKISGFGLVIPLGFGIATGLLLPGSLLGSGTDPVVFSLFLGVAMCVSAIPVIAKTLMDMGLLHRNIGQLTLTAGMVDDAFGWFMLSVVSAMATSGVRAGSVVLSLAYLVAVILFAVVVGRPLVAKVFQLAGRSQEAMPTIMTATALIILSAAGTHALGLEAIFGAFVCGILISEYGKPDPARLAPLRTVVLSVFAPIFFATAGLRMDLTALTRIDVLGAAALILAIAIVGKFVGAYIGARTSRLSNWEALALGAGMNARGVVEVIVAMVGLRLGVLNTATYTIIVLVAVVTSLMAPPILRVAMARVEQTEEEDLRQREHALT